MWPSLIWEYVGPPVCLSEEQRVRTVDDGQSKSEFEDLTNFSPPPVPFKASNRSIPNQGERLGEDDLAGDTAGICPHSFIPVSRPFVIPGGRFRELYYWDSYWIVEGLLRSGGPYVRLARDMIENLLDLIEKIGYVPNGSRVYYLNRSQPPMLTQMVEAYVRHVDSTAFVLDGAESREELVQSLLERALPLLEREYNFWMSERKISVKMGSTHYTMNIYSVKSNQPRPEAYTEDFVAAGKERSRLTAMLMYADIASGSESGWDFSSRWMEQPHLERDGTSSHRNLRPLSGMSVSTIIPVDLNSIMFMNEVSMAKLAMRVTNSPVKTLEAASWASRAEERARGIEEIFWNSTHFSFFDYNTTANGHTPFVALSPGMGHLRQRSEEEGDNVEPDWDLPVGNVKEPHSSVLGMYASSWVPFWAGLGSRIIRTRPDAHRALGQLHRMSHRFGAIAVSNYRSGEQWDYPNMWPPLAHATIAGLMRFSRETLFPNEGEFEDIAVRLAQQYLDSTYCTWRETGKMYERYSVEGKKLAGVGGEYEVADGFGWTNGVLVWIADEMGANLVLPNCDTIEMEAV